MSELSAITTADDLTSTTIRIYRKQGFIHIPSIISQEEAEYFREAALELSMRMQSLTKGKTLAIFTQLVNAWREDEKLKQLTMHPNVGAVAERLAGMPLRLWHDHVLIKQPHNNAPTEFHQDQPYWPHAHCRHALSAWIALVDVPVERGCMTFIPGSQRMTDLKAQDLTDAQSLLSMRPELQWEPRVTVPLKAGDCTFHHARTAHMATPNLTNDPRVAHIVIYMDARTTYTGARHVVTNPLDLASGQVLDGELFPQVADFPSSAH